MPRRLNSEIRALIPIQVERNLEKRQIHDLGNERCEDNAQLAA